LHNIARLRYTANQRRAEIHIEELKPHAHHLPRLESARSSADGVCSTAISEAWEDSNDCTSATDSFGTTMTLASSASASASTLLRRRSTAFGRLKMTESRGSAKPVRFSSVVKLNPKSERRRRSCSMRVHMIELNKFQRNLIQKYKEKTLESQYSQATLIWDKEAAAKTVWGPMRAEQVSIAQRWRRPRSGTIRRALKPPYQMKCAWLYHYWRDHRLIPVDSHLRSPSRPAPRSRGWNHNRRGLHHQIALRRVFVQPRFRRIRQWLIIERGVEYLAIGARHHQIRPGHQHHAVGQHRLLHVGLIDKPVVVQPQVVLPPAALVHRAALNLRPWIGRIAR